MSYEKAVLHTSDAARLAEAAKKLLPGDQAFTIFTSGSTGTPKGTVLTHANVIAYCGWFVERFSIGPDTNFGSQTPFYFSMSVSDLFGAWLSGAAYHIIPKSYFAFPARLVHYINERKIDTIYWVPTALGIVARCDLLSFERFRYMKNVFLRARLCPSRF
ncbi:MAG: AMP-binding protein [Christensenellaceae bacterium]